jgi:catalase
VGIAQCSVGAFLSARAVKKQTVRCLIVPEKLVHIAPEKAGKQPPDFLFDDLTRRIARKPVVFHLKAQLAEPGDQTNDASQPWPDDRKVVDLGVLTLTKVVPDSLEAEKKLLFLPTRLIDGIELSDRHRDDESQIMSIRCRIGLKLLRKV